MGDRLRAADLRAVLDFTSRTLRVGDHKLVPPVVLRGLAGLVGCDRAALTHLDLHDHREVAVFWPPAPPDRAAMSRYAELTHTHPLRGPLRRLAATSVRTITPLRMSDVLGRREWTATPLYRDVMRTTSDQLCLPLVYRGNAVHVVTLSRQSGTFTARQRDLLDACSAHLRRVVVQSRRDGCAGHQLTPRPATVPLSTAPGVSTTRTIADGALTAREREVIGLVAAGLTDAQIAHRLGLRPATVSKHLHRVYTRLGLRNRADAVRYATLEHGHR